MPYIRDPDIPWSESLTLEEWVMKMIEEKKTQTPEFQAALGIYGREKFTTIWEKYRDRKHQARRFADDLGEQESSLVRESEGSEDLEDDGSL